MRFLPSGLGDHKVILGYPCVRGKPTEDRLGTRMDRYDAVTTHPPKRECIKTSVQSGHKEPTRSDREEILYIGRIHVESCIARQTMSSTLAEEHDKPRSTLIPLEYQTAS